MELRFWAATNTGRVRDHNEDNFLVDKRLQLFVVCDGMGGHAAGEVASAVCVRTVRDVVAEEGEFLARLRENSQDATLRQSAQELLGRAILTACNRIFEMAQQDPSRRGMGTTCTALILAGDHGFIGHVGDSRMYRLREGQVEQVTTDHSLLNEMIRQGKIPADTSEATFPHKNAVTRAVGVREYVEVETFEMEVRSDDRYIMCSDGLSEYLDGAVPLVDLMGHEDPKETTTLCIDHANLSGGKDNITVIVIDCETEEAADVEETTRVVEILRKTAYFHYLTPPELEELRKMAQRQEYEADETILAAEAANDRLFILLKGSVSLQLDGKQLSVLTTGEHFGEMALIDAQDEEDTNLVAQALEPTEVLTIARDKFIGLFRTAPGMAIKLLWNFVQVFADRLQSVPPEYRFTPDEWRREPNGVTEETPPSGSLVFEEDIRRLQSRGEGGEDLGEAEARLESPFSATQEESGEPRSVARNFDDSFARQKTISLSDVDFNRLDGSAPEAGGGVEAGDDFDDSSSERARKGIVSGTYDTALLAGGFSGDETSLNGGANTQQAAAPTSDGRLVIGAEAGESEDERELAKTVDLDVDLEQLRAMRAQTPDALKEKIRQRLKERAKPSAAVLQKASEAAPGESPSRATAGESEVAYSPRSAPPAIPPEHPKVMISPDLMTNVDED